MDYTILGRTGLRVSVAGLGCGGPSRLGQSQHKTERESIKLVQLALDMGVNLIDTAESYGTEPIVGRALDGVRRDQVILSTKKTPVPSSHPDPGIELRKSLEKSLRQLQTDYIDIFHLHGIEPEEYEYVVSKLVPPLMKLRQEGKFRFLGITEAFIPDPRHVMLRSALDDDCWDVVMVGFNMLNQMARTEVFPKTRERNIGVLNMFAVRRALSRPARLRQIVADLKQRGIIDADTCDDGNPLGFVLQSRDILSIPEAAYRYCRHEPGVHVVLTGTGNPEHLKKNLENLSKPPLDDWIQTHLRKMFAKVDDVTGS